MQGLADSQTSGVPDKTSPPRNDSPPRRGGGKIARGPFVRVMTFVIIALVVAMMWRVFWPWVTVREPTSAVMVTGDQTLDGAKVRVVRHYDDAEVVATLNADNNFETPVLLEPAYYSITVTHENHTILAQSFVVEQMKCIPYTLPLAAVVSSANSQRDLKVTITGINSFRELGTLNAANGNREAFYLLPGSYHVTALTAQGQPVAQQDFTVERGKPTKINLGQSIVRAD